MMLLVSSAGAGGMGRPAPPLRGTLGLFPEEVLAESRFLHLRIVPFQQNFNRFKTLLNYSPLNRISVHSQRTEGVHSLSLPYKYVEPRREFRPPAGDPGTASGVGSTGTEHWSLVAR